METTVDRWVNSFRQSALDYARRHASFLSAEDRAVIAKAYENSAAVNTSPSGAAHAQAIAAIYSEQK